MAQSLQVPHKYNGEWYGTCKGNKVKIGTKLAIYIIYNQFKKFQINKQISLTSCIACHIFTSQGKGNEQKPKNLKRGKKMKRIITLFVTARRIANWYRISHDTNDVQNCDTLLTVALILHKAANFDLPLDSPLFHFVMAMTGIAPLGMNYARGIQNAIHNDIANGDIIWV